MKRKNESPSADDSPGKKRALSDRDAQSRFREGLFAQDVLDKYKEDYAVSEPYKHGVVKNLISDGLLRRVRTEIQNHLSFTPKETDIYKIHQSGDLANLDGLDAESLSRLPSLLHLRDALYSPAFRTYIASIAGFEGGASALSGSRTDMAINVYTPGCHLLCHDDVIGSRRVSYILYLTDPDHPWQAEWGGALRLYPTELVPVPGDEGDKEKSTVRVPCPEFTKVIPPAWNQLAFFEVRPGESFHDVEEVYHPDESTTDDHHMNGNSKTQALKGGEGRIRMAISGWYHIPQEGEDGYEPGLEESLAEKSSLAQLQGGRADRYELPTPHWTSKWNVQADGNLEETQSSDEVGQEGDSLTDTDFDFLLKFMDASYLVPETVSGLVDNFTAEYGLTLERVLKVDFAESLRKYIESLETDPIHNGDVLPGAQILSAGEETSNIMERSNWAVARPPHKQHYLFKPSKPRSAADNPLDLLLNHYLPSKPFRKWLALVTRDDGMTYQDGHLMARRFRRGRDYTLATSSGETEMTLEFTLGLTPTDGWGSEADDDDEVLKMDSDTDENVIPANGTKARGRASSQPNGKGEGAKEAEKLAGALEEDEPEQEDSLNVGGYEVYMAGDDADDDEGGGEEAVGGSSHTGAGHRPKGKSDAAIYQKDADPDGGILLSMSAGFNCMSLVLRDSGVLRFTKYVSKAAKGDRWDIVGSLKCLTEDDD